LSNWQNTESEDQGFLSDFKKRLSFAKRPPEKLAVVSETILDLTDSIFIRIVIAVLALYLIWMLLI
jgi:hypothetical protein